MDLPRPVIENYSIEIVNAVSDEYGAHRVVIIDFAEEEQLPETQEELANDAS